MATARRRRERAGGEPLAGRAARGERGHHEEAHEVGLVALSGGADQEARHERIPEADRGEEDELEPSGSGRRPREAPGARQGGSAAKGTSRNTPAISSGPKAAGRQGPRISALEEHEGEVPPQGRGGQEVEIEAGQDAAGIEPRGAHEGGCPRAGSVCRTRKGRRIGRRCRRPGRRSTVARGARAAAAQGALRRLGPVGRKRRPAPGKGAPRRGGWAGSPRPGQGPGCPRPAVPDARALRARWSRRRRPQPTGSTRPRRSPLRRPRLRGAGRASRWSGREPEPP